MPLITKYEPGQHNMECRSCCGYFKAREMVKQWNGLWVCFKCVDPYPAHIFRRDPPMKDPKPLKEVQGPESEIEEFNQYWVVDHYEDLPE